MNTTRFGPVTGGGSESDLLFWGNLEFLSGTLKVHCFLVV
jgi:hypothetical protein